MKSMLRTLALVSACCLWNACVDEKPSASPKPKTPKVEQQPALTAAAPSQPRSILDTPSPAPLAAVAPPSEALGASKEPSKTKENDMTTAGATAKDPHDALKDVDGELSADAMHIARFVLASGVAEREPVGQTDTFSTETEKIWAFVEFANEQGAPFAVRVHWENVDGPVSPYGFVLDIPTAKRFRTWSWTAIRRSPGQYRAVLRTLDGQELASRSFEIKAPDAL
jgi:hypothetical protein